MRDLTAYQRDLLFAAWRDRENRTGKDIKNRLDEYRGRESQSGQFYQALNRLVDLGYFEVDQVDGRTKDYRLTEEAVSKIEDRIKWVSGGC